MAYEDVEGTTSGISQLSSMDSGGGMDSEGAAAGGPPTAGQGPSGAAPGGPGPDTPQEQQALKLLMQAAVALRRAAEVEPSIRYIIDDTLQKAYLSVTKHYGMEQEGKLALQQAKLRADRGRAVALTGPPRQRPTAQGI